MTSRLHGGQLPGRMAPSFSSGIPGLVWLSARLETTPRLPGLFTSQRLCQTRGRQPAKSKARLSGRCHSGRTMLDVVAARRQLLSATAGGAAAVSLPMVAVAAESEWE